MSAVCLHIGLPKTGSSAIQSFLAARAPRLAKLGVHYAMNAHTETVGAVASSGNGRGLVKYLDPRRRRPGFDEAQFERVLQKAYFQDKKRISVISSELLASIDFPRLTGFRERVLDGRPVVVVAVVRNLYDHALSSWNQAVKWHAYAGSFDHYAQNEYANHQCKTLMHYGAYLGWENLRLIQYEACRGDLVGAFLEAIDTPTEAKWKAPRTNRSLTTAELSVQRALNRLHETPSFAKEAAERFIARRPDVAAAPLWRPDIARLLADRFAGDVLRLGHETKLDLTGLLEPKPRTERAASPMEYVRAFTDVLPVAARALRARWAAPSAGAAGLR